MSGLAFFLPEASRNSIISTSCGFSRVLAAQESPENLSKLIEFLAAPNHDSEPNKIYSPFVGLSIVVEEISRAT